MVFKLLTCTTIHQGRSRASCALHLQLPRSLSSSYASLIQNGEMNLQKIVRAWAFPARNPVVTVPGAAGGGGIITLLGSTMARLAPGRWLDDEIVNIYFHFLDQRDIARHKIKPSRRRNHYFSSFMLEKMMEPEIRDAYSYGAVHRWSRKIDQLEGSIFNLDKVFFPVNIDNYHWCLVVAFIQDKKLQYYDSMGGSGRKYLVAIQKYLIDEAKKATNASKKVVFA